jgi:hypothetical protein
MTFNQLVGKYLTEDFRVPFDSKRRVTARNSSKFSSQNRVFDTDPASPQAYSGFKGDRLNGKMITSVFVMPKIKRKKKRKLKGRT